MAIQYSRATEIMETHRFLIASTADQWADFLRGSCRFESYSFENQIMILAQRVNPTAVASYEHWNTVQECSVIKGRKGIALFNEYGTGLRYVFDAADVREIHDKNRNGHKPVLWTMEERHRDIVLTGLQERYGSVITATDDFEDRVKAYINAAVGEFIMSEPEYLDMSRDVQALIFSSVEFAVLNRMGLSPAVMDYPAFDNISKYAMNEEILHAIGNATQKVSGSMLRDIGRDINRYDMERVTELGIEGIYTARKGFTDQFIASLENSPVNGLANASQEVHNAVEADKTNDTMEGQSNAGRTDIHEGRGLSVSEHYSGSTADRAVDEVRENEDRIHERTQADSLLDHEDERDIGIPLPGDSETGGGDAEEPHGTDGKRREDNRRTERERSAGMDRSHEQNNGSSGRTSASERGLQLEYTGENLVYEQMSLFAPDEMEQIGSIMAGGSHSFEPVPAEYELSKHHLEDLLRTGSGRDDSRHRIWNQFSIGKSPEEIIDFLRKEYRQCGKGFTIDGHNISIYAEKEGIRFGFGESAYEQPINIRIGTGRGDIVNGLLPWEDVENILRHMVQEGSYLSTSEAYMTPEIERKRVARMIWAITDVLVVNDGSGQDHEMERVSVLPEKMYGEEENNSISELLSTPQGIQTIHSRLLEMISQKERGEIIQRFRSIYSLEGAVSEVEDMMREHIVFPTLKEVEVRQEDFITQDEIDSCLGCGSGFAYGSFRIYDYFMEGHDSKEAAKFLKNEYGIGGSSSAIAGTEHSWQNHDAKGIRLDKGRISSPYTSILLPWKAVEKRIRKLIEEDKYLSPSGKEFYAKYKEEQAQKALEQEQAKIEREIKVACKDAIERAITEKFDVDGVRLLEDTAEAVIKEYGIERVTYVLANTVAHNRQDEHFSEENREWSKEIEPYAMWKNSDLVASSHLAAIDGFINQTRHYIEQEAASAGMTVEEYVANGYEPYTAEPENTEDVEETADTTLDWHIIHEADDDNGKPTQWSATLPNGDFLWIDAETEGYALYNTEKTDAGHISISPTLDDAKADGESYAAELLDLEAAASLVSERNREAIEKIVVGSRITLPDGEWEVKRLDGDFILSMDNIDKNSQMATRSMVGAWKEQLLQEAGNNPISVFSPGIDNEKAPEPEQKLTVTLTVAECGEFHNLGEYHEGIPTVDEAIAIYNRIPPERMNGIPSIGIRLRTIGSEDYEDVEADILSGGIIDLEILDYIPDITGSKEAMALIAELIEKVPDAEIRGSLDKWLSQEDAALNAAEDLPKTADNIQLQTTIAHNFRITDDALGVGGAKEKFEKNIHAIETLKRIEADNRDATREEQQILSQYVGWGGLSDAFDANKPNWGNEYNRLQSVLTAEEYAAARRSTLDAFYTSPIIIREIYQKMADMGFEGGNVLEPSCAIGNFFGMMPEKMQQASKLFGVELDSVSGRIAQKLYPDAEISISGYENASLSDDFFDIAVGNVPFGEIRPYDKTYAKENFLIHDYFFAKTLDKVRAGGVIAFITSKGTLDKQSDDVRRYIAERADFLGAVRLPDTAFKANAGTEVTSDIIFLQKRDEAIQLDNDNLPSWCSLSADENGISLNKYFAEHPEQICGSMKMVSGPFGPVSTCKEDTSRPLSDQLKAAMSYIQGVIDKSFVQVQTENNHEAHTLPADDQVRNYSYAVVDDRVYYKSNSVMEEVKEKPDTINRIKDMCAIRDAVQDVLNIQIEDPDNEAAFKEKQGHLNAVYDAFEKKYGRIGSRTNKRAFENDASYCLLRSLEKYDDDGNFKEKSAIFTKRTVKPIIRIESCENSLDALFASLSEKAVIDFDYMSSLCGRTREEMLSDLTGIIFQNPETNKYETAEEYLSGNVRKKLEFAQDMVAHGYEEYAVNVKHLEQVQPEKLKASEIAVRLGATWIEPEYINQFMKETFEMPERLFQKPYYWRQDSLSECGATMNEYTNEWTVRGKRSYNNAIINSTYGSSRRNALLILEDSLNLRDSRVYDVVIDPATQKERRVLNQKETIIVQQKQELLKEKFNDWIFSDPDRREYLVEKYNTLFNSTRPRTYDGSHLTFSGIANGITLNPHQKDAIARVLYGGNTLLAHAVGAGKTYEMIAAAMESKRLGLCNKSLFVVPNHLTEQWGASFMKLYPNANILVATKKDFEPANRKEFCSRIATGDYDAVIIGHTQFERIPLSPERIADSVDKQISDIQECIDTTLAAEGKKSPSVKQLEKQKQTLERRLKELNDAPKDDVVTFEQLGVDRLFVDESHNFKNLFTYTKMRNVAGISTSEAKKSTDLYQKCQYLDDITGGKGIIFASGTPISNSMTELFTNMRYLQSEKLRQMNLQNFDAWASTFGETQTAMELAPEGTGYRSKTRFAKFFNLPELMNIFKDVADVKTSDMLDLDVPEAVYEDVVTEPSQYQKDIVSSLADRAEAVRGGSVDRHNDNMLKITNDGRMAALDQRLINPMLPDDPNSKVNHCVEKSFAIWNETKADKLTQVIFCDLSTPSKDGRFNVYDDIKKKLIEKGVPEKEIAFIHDADTEVKKANLFAKVRSGEVRFILGSTPKLGAGTNIQHKLTALHHLDVPWRPSDIEQQEGRIIRQHNSNDKVKIFRYITKDTFDAYSWQLIENKQKFIGQIMTSKSPVRMADDVDEQALNYAEIKALATGNPLIKEKMDLDVQVNKLKMLKGAYQSSIFQMQDNITKILPQRIARNEEYIADLKKDMALYAEKKAELLGQNNEVVETLPLGLETDDKAAEKDPEKEPFKMEVCGVTYDSRVKAGEALIAACSNIKTADTSFEIGEFCGFKMNITFDALSKRFVAGLKGNRNYVVDLDSSAIGNTIRIKNTLENLGRELDNAQKRLADARNELETAQREVSKPFPKEDEYQEKMLRLLEVNRLLEQGDKSVDQDDLTQLVNNIDYVVDSYLSQINDFGDPLLSEEELLDMCKAEIFDIMADGMGSCKEEKGICDRLRSLGDDVIAEKILEHGREILNTENQERSISLSSMKKEVVEKKSADQPLHEPTTLQKQTVL